MPSIDLIPRRQSLAENVTRLLEREILEGTWRGWLADERTLSKRLHVSRNTLRIALRRLASDGLIETVHGRGHRIVSAAGAAAKEPRTKTVGVLVTKEVHGSRQFTSLFIDEVRSLLYDMGIEMQLYSGRQYAKSHPYKALERLIERAPHSCWLLCGGLANGAQRWFEQRSIPTLVSGIRDPRVTLPAVSVDSEALGRKAAELILEAGHRRILLITPGAAENGFIHGIEAFQKSHHCEGIDLSLAQYHDDADVFHRNLAQVLKRRDPPTAIFINESDQYLRTVSYLMACRIRVPEEVSLVCRDSEPYLEYLLPEPTRFKKSPIVYGDLLVERITKLIHEEPIKPAHTLVVPEIVPGNSLGPPP